MQLKTKYAVIYMSNDKFEKEKKMFLKNMNEDDFKAYLDKLIKDYYKAYLENDSELFNKSKKELDFVYTKNKDMYNNLINYFNSRLILIGNNVLHQLFQRKLELIVPYAVDLHQTNIDNVWDFDLMDRIIAEEKDYEDRKNNCLNKDCPYYS